MRKLKVLIGMQYAPISPPNNDLLRTPPRADQDWANFQTCTGSTEYPLYRGGAAESKTLGCGAEE